MYNGDGSERFAVEVVAANAVSGGQINTVTVAVLHASSSCYSFIEEKGNTVIVHIDKDHINVGGISMDDLCEIFTGVDVTGANYTDMHQVGKYQINAILHEWWNESDNYKNLFREKFSEKRVNKIENG